MSNFLNLFQGLSSSYPPLWFMRQAGRYLPEYLKMRSQHKSFLDLCYTPKDAALVTLQPIERYDFDVAILFSDILVIPDCLGQRVTFKTSEGPHLSLLSVTSYQKDLSPSQFIKKATPVYEAIHLVKSRLSSSKALLGFAGAPWTLALYMLEGKGGKDFYKARQEAFREEELFSQFLAFLSGIISLHLTEQVKAGAQAIQLFDSWAGLCPATHFKRWVIDPTRKIVDQIRKEYPDLPIIGFPRGGGSQLIEYSDKTGVSGISLDQSVSLSWCRQEISNSIVLQGNLDPFLLVTGGKAMEEAIQFIHGEMAGRPYIFNLGHGILPETPLSHVEDCVKWVRRL